MNNKQKIKNFRRFIDIINESYETKIFVSEIFFIKGFKFNKKSRGGYHKKLRHIVIKNKLSFKKQVYVFVHELVHAYQDYKRIPFGHDSYFYDVMLDFLMILQVI